MGQRTGGGDKATTVYPELSTEDTAMKRISVNQQREEDLSRESQKGQQVGGVKVRREGDSQQMR